MKIKFTDGTDSIYYNKVRDPGSMNLPDVNINGKKYTWVKSIEKNYPIGSYDWLCLFCRTLIKTIFAERSTLRKTELIEAWKTIWTTKKIVAIYEPSPVIDLEGDEEFEYPMSPFIEDLLESLETDDGVLGASSAEQDLYVNLMYMDTEDEPKLISILGEEYEITATEHWIQFDLVNSQADDLNKIHVSVERSLENISKAFLILVTILAEYKVQSFKVTSLGNYQNFEAFSTTPNALGKEFVIYINDEGSIEEWENHLKKIVEKFQEQGVKPGNPSKGDLPLQGGHSYLYTRAPHNFFGQYIEANLLESAGFTAYEAATISPSPWLNLKITTEPTVKAPLIQEKSIPSNANSIQLKDIEDILYAKTDQINQLTNFYLKLFQYHLRTYLFQLIIGTDPDNTVDDSSPFFPYLAHIYNTTDSHYTNDSPINPLFLQDQLQEAAHLAAIATFFNFQQHGNHHVKEADRLFGGNILPAIYKFLQNYQSQNKDPGKISIQPCGSTEEENNLIKSLVKCALRKPINQIKDEKPIYQFDLSERQIDELVDILLSNHAMHGTSLI